MPSYPVLAGALLLAAVLPAQHIRWQLPPGGVAIYAQKIGSRSQVIESDREPPPNAVHPFGNVRHVPVLLQTELDSTARFVTSTPLRIDALAPYLAFDLRTARPGAVRVEMPRVEPFGDLTAVGRAGPVGGDGTQVLELELHRRDIARGPESEREYEHWREHMFDWGLEGQIRIVRRIDRARGLVVAFTAELEAVHRDPKTPARRATRFHLDQGWTLREVVAPGHAKFQARVDAAIAKGRAFVRREIANPRIKRCQVDPEASRGAGHLALALLALLKAEVPRSDTVVEQGFAELRRREITNTCSLALAIMAVEALYAPPGERRELLDGQLERPRRRRLPAAELALVRAWAERLLANRDQQVDDAYLSRWNYRPGHRYDNSNTQYALLGLYSAHLCGVQIPAGVWVAGANHLLADRKAAEGPEVRLRLTGHAAVEQLARRSPAERARGTLPPGRPAQARGWGYWDDDTLAYGSMVAAGISGLTICSAVMRETGKKGPLLDQIDRAIRDGFAWLARYPELRSVPGRNTWRRGGHYFYFLYSFERASELSRVAWIEGRDWYFDRANLLLAMQADSGTFGGRRLDDNCFAVLFLSAGSTARKGMG